MKFFDKMYVGFQRSRYDNAETPRLLGFAVPYENTKSSEKRRNTVDGWAQKDLPSRTIDNVPTRGFKLCEVVSRYSTSNKLFRLIDPRGFELEISTDNLLDIALVSTIVKGEIVEECVWTSGKNGKVYLCPVSSPEYKHHMKAAKAPSTKTEVGQYYVSPGNLLSVFRYEGSFTHTYIDIENIADVYKLNPSRGSYYNTSYDISSYIKNIYIKMGKKSCKIYTEFTLEEDGNVKSIRTVVRGSLITKLDLYQNDIVDGMRDHVFDPTHWGDYSGEYENPKGHDSLSCNVGGSGYPVFHLSPKDARAYDFSSIIKMISDMETTGDRVKVLNGDRYGHWNNHAIAPDAKVNIITHDKR